MNAVTVHNRGPRSVASAIRNTLVGLVTLAFGQHPARKFEDLTISLRPTMPSPNQVLRDTQEISHADVHRFKISHPKEPHKGFVGNFFGFFIAQAATNKSKNAVIARRVKITHDAGAKAVQVFFGAGDID